MMSTCRTPGRDRCVRGAIETVLVACMALAMAASPAAAAGREGDRSPAPAAATKKTQIGIASVYARMLDGRRTASGELHDEDDLTAAHRTLPLGSEVRVTNLANHRSVVVRVNDRGPNVRSRIIDLSRAAAAKIGLRARAKGLARVRVEVLREPESAAASNGATPRSDTLAQLSAADAASTASARAR